MHGDRHPGEAPSLPGLVPELSRAPLRPGPRRRVTAPVTPEARPTCANIGSGRGRGWPADQGCVPRDPQGHVGCRRSLDRAPPRGKWHDRTRRGDAWHTAPNPLSSVSWVRRGTSTVGFARSEAPVPRPPPGGSTRWSTSNGSRRGSRTTPVHQRGQVAALRQHHVGSKRSRVVEHADREDREIDAGGDPHEQLVWRVGDGHQGLRGLPGRNRVASLEHHREPGHRMGEGIHRGTHRSEVSGFERAQVAERQVADPRDAPPPDPARRGAGEGPRGPTPAHRWR